jgi:proteasome lid subunit RPN8/RPN11
MNARPEPAAPASEIQLGEPQSVLDRDAPAVRPDRDPHRAVAVLGDSQAARRVFIELEAWRAMVRHACSDTTVELGGILLGYRCHAESNESFAAVVVTDVLEARHYHATRGSFKFTHDTWSDLTQRRSSYPPSTVVLGWYHTHPGWGIFLSGMDRFICDHFFTDPAAVALVIDPVAQSFGWFHWSDPPPDGRLEQLSGCTLFAHRNRADELQTVALQPVGELAMNPLPSAGPIIVTQPATPNDRWLWLSVLALAASQLLFGMIIGLLGWWALGSREVPADSSSGLAMEREWLQVREQVVDQVLQQLAQHQDGQLASLRAVLLENQELAAANAGLNVRLQQLQTSVSGERDTLSAEALSGSSIDRPEPADGSLTEATLQQVRSVQQAVWTARWWPIEPVSFLYGIAFVSIALGLERLRRVWIRQRHLRQFSMAVRESAHPKPGSQTEA